MLEAVDKIQPKSSAADTRQRPQPEEGPLSILYEDEAVLVLDKPAGTVIHPTYKNTHGTLLNAVLWHVRDHAAARPGILTRLDKHTSGVVVIGLLPDTHARMQRDAAAGRIRKEYLAVVHGRPDPPAGRIVLALARDAVDRRRVVPSLDGAACETRYQVIATRDAMSIVRCELVTGRTHQIRVHLASSGWPIVGDEVYGHATLATPGPALARQALHASRISLPHPITREPLTFEAPVPQELRTLVNQVLGCTGA